MVESSGLENQRTFTGTQGSNPCLSAILFMAARLAVLPKYLSCTNKNGPYGAFFVSIP